MLAESTSADDAQLLHRGWTPLYLAPAPRPADPMAGFACVMRDYHGREFLAVQTFGDSRGKATRAAMAMNSRRMHARKPALELLRVCEVGLRVLQGQPPVDNRFVADGCELFRA